MVCGGVGGVVGRGQIQFFGGLEVVEEGEWRGEMGGGGVVRWGRGKGGEEGAEEFGVPAWGPKLFELFEPGAGLGPQTLPKYQIASTVSLSLLWKLTLPKSQIASAVPHSFFKKSFPNTQSEAPCP